MSALMIPAGARRLLPAAAALAALGLGAAAAQAIPPGGVVDNPGGAVVTVAPSPVTAGGSVAFTGTGFASGEEVSVKIDDGVIFKAGGTDDVLAVVTASPSGAISGSISLAAINASTPVAPGDHWVRLLSGHPRSLKGTFSVVAAAPVDPGTGGSGGTGTTPGTGGSGSGGTGSGSGGTGSGGGTGTGTGTTTTPAPALIAITDTNLTVKRSKITLRVAAGTAGSAGRVRVRTLERFKIGATAKKRRDLVAKESYLVGKLGKAKIGLTLSKDGKQVLKRRKAVKAVAEFTDATGARVKQTITVNR